jgi:hypothetical protein
MRAGAPISRLAVAGDQKKAVASIRGRHVALRDGIAGFHVRLADAVDELVIDDAAPRVDRLALGDRIARVGQPSGGRMTPVWLVMRP